MCMNRYKVSRPIPSLVKDPSSVMGALRARLGTRGLAQAHDLIMSILRGLTAVSVSGRHTVNTFCLGSLHGW